MEQMDYMVAIRENQIFLSYLLSLIKNIILKSNSQLVQISQLFVSTKLIIYLYLQQINMNSFKNHIEPLQISNSQQEQSLSSSESLAKKQTVLKNHNNKSQSLSLNQKYGCHSDMEPMNYISCRPETRELQFNLSDNDHYQNPFSSEEIKPELSQQIDQQKFKSQDRCSLERLNYKRLLLNEIDKNKHLEKNLRSEQKKNVLLREIIDKMKEQSFILKKKMHHQSQKNNEQSSKIKQIDTKLVYFRNQCKHYNSTSTITKKEINAIKKQDKRLKQENFRYQQFTDGLAQSLRILNGKKPENMKRIWIEWKKILEQINYYRCRYGKIAILR